MKRNLLFTTTALLAGSLLAVVASPKDEVTSAAKKLADQSNYSWKSTTESPGGRGFGGPGEGKTEKGGCTWMSFSMRDNTIETVIKGDKGAVKTQDGWQSLADLEADQQGPGRFMGRMARNFKAPANQAEDLAGKTKDLKHDGDVYSGDLTEEGAKSLMTFGGRGGGNGPEISDAKGSVKFWIKDGMLSKYEVKVQGKINFNGNDREVDRTTTYEIKDVGTTKIELPEEAKKKLS